MAKIMVRIIATDTNKTMYHSEMPGVKTVPLPHWRVDASSFCHM
jgi:hypothetical protein